MEDNVKQALLDGTATIQTEIEILSKDNTDNVILTEENGVVSWDYEDFRYVKDEGWIGQFIAKQVNGTIKNISDDFSMTDKEFVLKMGVNLYYNIMNVDEEIDRKHHIYGASEQKTTNGANPNPDYPSEIINKYNAGTYQTIIDGKGYVFTISDDLSGIDDVKNELIIDKENLTFEFTKRVGKIVLNGIESWSYVADKKGAILTNYVRVGSPYALSNQYICSNSWTTWTGDNQFGFNSDNVLWVQFGDTFASFDEFRTHIQNNPIIIYYVLPEPIVTTGTLEEKEYDTHWYSLGNFLVTKVTDDEVGDKTTFEALDYTKKFNQKYVDDITYPCTALELAQNVCQQCGCELGNTDFKHNDWEITGNAFTNGESCRDVLKTIGKLAYSWVRVDWDNKVYLDFTVNKTTEEYNKITNHEYYTLKTQKEKIGAINRVVIGYKDIEGERTKVENAEDIEVNGVHEITIFDNPLVYNQELRKKAIIGAEELLDLEYMPMEMLTVGHPWLRGDELLEVTDMEGKVHKTIPFDRTIQYFGHIKTNINVATNTKTNTEYSYEGGVGGRLRKTEISVDKINGQIIEIIQEQDETTEKLNETISTVDETTQTISRVETTVTDITTTTQTSTGGNNLHIEKALESNALDYVIEGMSYQETTAGKNKFDNILNQSGAIRLTSSVFKIEPNTTYTFSTTADNIQIINYYKDIDKVDISNTAWETLPFTYTTPDNCHNIQLLIRRNADSNIVPSDLTNAQLEEGSVVTDYEPYIPRPNPDYPQDVEVIEPYNLFDKNNITIIEAVIDSSNGKINPNVNTKSFYMKIPEGVDVLTVSRSFGERFCVGTTDVIPATNVTCLNYIGNNSAKAITIPVLDNSKYIIVYYYNKNIDTSTEQEILDSIQIVEGTVTKPYTPFGSIQTKIIGKNWFDFEKFITNLKGIYNGELGEKTNNSVSFTSTSDDCYTYDTWTMSSIAYNQVNNFGGDILPNTTYTFSLTKKNNVDGTQYVFLYDENYNYISLVQIINELTKTFTTPSNAKYFSIRLGIKQAGYTEEFSDVLLVREGDSEEYEPYQEKNVYINLQGNFIGKIGDIKDELRIENGRAILTKRIGKFIPNENTNIFPVATPVQNNSKFYGILSDFKAANNNLTQIYSNIFTGKPANIVWLNDIIYSCSVNGGSSLHFRVDTTLDNATLVRNFLIDNNCYFIGVLTEPYEVDLGDINIPLFEGTNNISLIQDLETTTSIRYLRETPLSGDSLLKQQLDATNNSLSDTTNRVNQNTSDINNTNVNLNNNYYNKNQIDVMNSSTSQELTQIKNSVETKITAEDLNIAITEIKTTGVTQVVTETGYTFDKEGLKIQKSDSEMSSLLDNDGLVVKRDETEVLTVRSQGVETENLTVRTYFTIGDNTRVENYKGGTGFFYVGGAD